MSFILADMLFENFMTCLFMTRLGKRCPESCGVIIFCMDCTLSWSTTVCQASISQIQSYRYHCVPDWSVRLFCWCSFCDHFSWDFSLLLMAQGTWIVDFTSWKLYLMVRFTTSLKISPMIPVPFLMVASFILYAYRTSHSTCTEAALLNISTDLLSALGEGKISVLALVDLSAAYSNYHCKINIFNFGYF